MAGRYSDKENGAAGIIYGNPDGTDIVFNEDYFGDHRGISIIPGPFVSAEALNRTVW